MFDSLLADKVKLLKKDGKVIDNIKASVQHEQIIVFRSDIIIDEGDIISRVLSNGKEELYKVLDPVFYENVAGISAHYQIKVVKTTQEKSSKNFGTVNITATDNAKVNFNSIDNSVYNINSNDLQVFEKLLDKAKNIPENSKIIEAINSMKNNVSNKKTFKEKYCEFIQVAANHITLFAPFIPVLTNFL